MLRRNVFFSEVLQCVKLEKKFKEFILVLLENEKKKKKKKKKYIYIYIYIYILVVFQ